MPEINELLKRIFEDVSSKVKKNILPMDDDYANENQDQPDCNQVKLDSDIYDATLNIDGSSFTDNLDNLRTRIGRTVEPPERLGIQNVDLRYHGFRMESLLD